MANPNAKPPEGGGFKPGHDERRNAGGRTPTAWLRRFLDAAHDKSEHGDTRREAIARHLLEVATSWQYVQKGKGESAVEVASARDSIEAAKVLYAYDMGKPVEAVEVTNPDGSLTPGRPVDSETTAEVRQKLERILGIPADAAKTAEYGDGSSGSDCAETPVAE